MAPEESPFFKEAPLEKVEEWSLVLTAMNIPHRVVVSGGRARLIVPKKWKKRALEELRLYEEENLRPRKPAKSRGKSPRAKGFESTFWTICCLTAVLSLTFLPSVQPILVKYGMGDARRILHGEWWRLVTALTLHNDPAHLLGNMLFGGIFLGFLRAYWPAGLAWSATILAGVLGNLINTVIRKDHLFLGASTSVFGALGVLCALRLLHGDRKRFVIALGAGLALLGMLGTGGERTDLLAHLFGFTAGFGLGLVIEPLRKHLEPYDFPLKLFSLCFPLLAWAIALYPFSFWQRSSILNY